MAFHTLYDGTYKGQLISRSQAGEHVGRETGVFPAGHVAASFKAAEPKKTPCVLFIGSNVIWL